MPSVAMEKGVVKFMQAMRRLGAKVSLYSVRKNYGVAVIYMKPAIEKIITDFNESWRVVNVDMVNDVERHVVVFIVSYSGDYVLTPEERERIKRHFQSRGIAAEASPYDEHSIAIAVYMDSYIKYLEKKVLSNINNVKHKVEYIPEVIIIAIHFYTNVEPTFVSVLDLVKEE